MSHRFTTWWRALSVVLLSLATVTWPSAARADTTARFTLVHQNAIAALGKGATTTVTTTLRLTPSGAGARADVTLYPALVTQSALSLIVMGDGTSQSPLAVTGSFALRCERHGEVTFAITIDTRSHTSSAPTCGGGRPRLRLACSQAACDGVYPLRYRVDLNGVTITKWSLLALRYAQVARPLQVSLIETLSRSALHHPKRSLAALDTLSHYANSPLSVSADYETLAAIAFTQSNGATWRDALNRALDSPLHRALNAPPSSIDFAGLDRHRLTTQVPEQIALSADLLKTLTGRYVDDPVLLSGDQSPASLLALERAGVSDVVLPEEDLTVAPFNTLTWGAPFHVVGAGSLSALSVDSTLSHLATDTAIEPGRRAALTLASLAFLHFEAPNAPATRSVVIEASLAATSTTFLSDLLSGLNHDPFSRLVSLTPSFDSSLIATNGAPASRALLATSPSSWSSRNVNTLLHLIGEVTSYTQGIRTGDVAAALRVAVARAEILGSAAVRQDAIDTAIGQLNAQLNQYSVGSSTITLAGPGTSLPITIISHASYVVHAVVHLVTDRISFPKGNALNVTLSSPTQSFRVATSNAHGSSLTLQVELTTPNGQVVLARSAIQVRIAGTSVVGYLLTFVSLFVLGLWWWRTNRRRSRGRHAR